MRRHQINTRELTPEQRELQAIWEREAELTRQNSEGNWAKIEEKLAAVKEAEARLAIAQEELRKAWWGNAPERSAA